MSLKNDILVYLSKETEKFVCVKFFSIRFKYRDSKTLFLYTFV